MLMDEAMLRYTTCDGHIQSCSACVSYMKLIVFVGGVRPKVEILATKRVSLRPIFDPDCGN